MELEKPERSGRALGSRLRIFSARLRVVLPPVAAAGLLIVAWEIVSTTGLVPQFLLPAPTRVLGHIGESSSLLIDHSLSTAYSTLLGFGAAVAFGILISVPIVWWRTFDSAISPLLVLTQVVPKIAIAPLLIVYVGYGTAPKVVLAFLLSFFPIVLNTSLGLRSVAPELLELMKTLRATKWQLLRKIQFPQAVPYVVEAAKVAITLAIIGSIVGEFTAGNEGLGFLIIRAASRFDVVLGFASLVVVALVGIVLYEATRIVGDLISSRVVRQHG